MSNSELFRLWAPEDGIWSPWAKPLIFSDKSDFPPFFDTVVEAQPEASVAWVPPPSDTALVVDLPGVASINLGLSLLALGYRPVPLYNAASAPMSVIPMSDIVRQVERSEAQLRQHPLRPDAPPAFLLDARRSLNTYSPAPPPGSFDNRWMTFPQDFPSANLLLSRGIRKAIVRCGDPNIAADLRHVLLRWQEAGIAIFVSTGGLPVPTTVLRPPEYRAWWLMALALVGLRRNVAGGFGSVIPMPSSSGGGYG